MGRIGTFEQISWILALVVGANVSVHAAMIDVLPRSKTTTFGDCQVRLSGSLEPNDSAALKVAIEKAEKLAEFYPAVLCLNSSGGDYSEALKIARRLINDNISVTKIEANAQCLSACALIFMAGGNRGSDFEAPYRIMHARAKLGFHAPFVLSDLLKSPQYSAEEFLSAYDAGIQNARELIDVFNKTEYNRSTAIKDKWMKASLINILLTRRPGELFEIDTVGKAGNWGITIEGYRPIRKKTREMYKSACRNHYLWRLDHYVDTDETKGQIEIGKLQPTFHGNMARRRDIMAFAILDGGSGGPACAIDIEQAEDGTRSGEISEDGIGARVPITVDGWQFYRGNTLLKDIAK